MPPQIPMPIMPDCYLRSKYEINEQEAATNATVPATHPAGRYPMLSGTTKPETTSRQAADNTIMLGVAVFGRLTPSQLENAVGTLDSTVKKRDAAHNGFVSNFHKLIEGSNNPMYGLINETVQIHDAAVTLHNLGCAASTARIAGQPAEAERLMGIINKFVDLVVYEIDLLIEGFGNGEGSIVAIKAHGLTSLKAEQLQDRTLISEESARLRGVEVRLGVPASANATRVPPMQTYYLLLSKDERYAFWKTAGNSDSIYDPFAFARGPMRIKSTFARKDNFWKYTLEMLASFCDSGYSMVIGIEKSNQRARIEDASGFMRSAHKSMIQPNRKLHQETHHGFNARYNNQVRLAGVPDQQITDIDSIYVDKYVRDINVLRRGGNHQVYRGLQVDWIRPFTKMTRLTMVNWNQWSILYLYLATCTITVITGLGFDSITKLD